MKIKANFLRDHSLAVALCALVCWLIPSSVWASVEIDGIYYELNTSSKTAEVVSNPDYYSGTINIPASFVYQGSTYNVTSIGNEAFGDCTGLTSVDIPNSVTSIDDAAFAYCSSLTEIIVERTTAPTITSSSFNGVNKSTCKVYVPEGCRSAYANAANWNAFSNIVERSVVATGSCGANGDNVTYIIYSDMTMVISGSDAMKNFTVGHINDEYYQSIKRVVIEEGITSIGDYAFYRFQDLTSVTIPNSVTNIGYNAFYDCDGLTFVTIPNSVTKIGNSAFENCDGLTTVTIPNSVTKIGDSAFNACSRLISVTIPNSVTSIAYGTFYECSSLTSVDIPNSVTSIGSYAFKRCESLTSVEIPNSVTSIGGEAFTKCTSLTSVNIPNSVTTIANNPFINCSSLTVITVDTGNINYDSRDNCNAIIEKSTNTLVTGCKNTVIPNSVTSIGDNAFQGCNLSSVIIPNSVTAIGSQAFYDCSSLTAIMVEKEIPISIDRYTFSYAYNSTCTLYVPAGSKTAYQTASWWNNFKNIVEYEIESVVLATGSCGDNVTYTIYKDKSIVISGTGAMWPNSSPSYINDGYYKFIQRVIIKDGVTSIGYEAFKGCRGLFSVEIPNSVSSIGDYSFYGCSGLTSVTIPNSVTSIGSSAFFGCTGLTSITVEGETPVSVGFFTFYNVDKSNCTLYVPAGSKSAYETAEYWSEFQSIVEYTLSPDVLDTGSCGDNVTYTIYDDMTMVISGTGAMDYYLGDTHINNDYYQLVQNLIIEEGVTSIGSSAFSGCIGLTSVTIPSSVTNIDWYAFSGCTGLTSVEIPNSVTTIGNYSFSGCSSLSSVTIPNSVTFIGSEAFEGTAWFNNKPDGLVYAGRHAYKYKGEMPQGTGIVIEDGTLTIVGMAFSGCTGLTSVEIPSSVTLIGENAFEGCTGLTSVTIPNSVTEIGAIAFQGCTGLTFVEIPNSLSEICDYAFSGCTGLTSLTIPNSVTIIGEEAFSGCTALTSISLPNSVTNICLNAFSGCTGLTSLTIPESVTEIGLGGFGGCTGLTSIVANGEIPAHLGMNSNGQYVMYEYAFMNVDKTNCTLYVPIGCKSVYENANGWSEFQNIVERGILATGSCGDNVTYTIYSDMSMVISGTGTIRCENNCKPKFPYYQSIERIIIEDGVTNIGQWAFSNCTSLTSITIPGSVSVIGIGAFIDCASLTSLTIENGVKTIQDCAFVRCSNLSSIVIPSSVTNIEVFDCTPFGQCPNLTSIIVDANNDTYDSRDNCNAIIKTLTNTLVEGCKNTVIPNSVTEIGSFAFAGCTGLTSVDIPNSVNKIGYAAFEDCTGLTALNIPSNVTDIEMLAFVGCTSLGSVTIPKNVTSIGERIFERCTGLNTIIVDANNETYDSRDNCNAIIETSTNTLIACCGNTFIPNSVTSISSCAFMDCINLTSVAIPSSVISIGDNAFWGCTGLTSITVEHATPISLPNSAFEYVDKANCMLYVPFGSKSAYEIAEYWSDFENIEESPVLIDNLYYSHNISDNTAIVEKIADKNYSGSINIPESIEYAGNTYAVTEIGLEAFLDCTSLTSVMIPNSVTRIVEGAFYGCTGLTSVEIPNSVTYIDDYTFDSCTGLTSVDIPNSVTNIGFCAFGRCTGLTSVNIPNSVTRIGDGAFVRCIGMTSINIPNSVIEIGVEAFENCTGLTSITVEHETPISLHCSVFENVDKTNCTLYVPVGSKTAYENAEGWNEFENIVEIGEEPDTDISEYDNIVYIEGAEALVGQQIRLSLKMNNTIASTGFQCDVYLPEGVTAAQDEDGFYLMDISEERTTSKKTDFSSSVLQPDGGLRFMCSSTKSYTFSGNEGEVAYLMVDIDPNMEEGTYPLILRNIEISDANSNPYRVSYVKTTLTVNTYTLGDANNDGSIGVSDFTAIANYIMGTPPASFVEKAADVNVDGVISVSDLTGEANIILYGTVTPNASHAKARNEVTAKYANIGANDVTANSDKEFSVAITIDGNYAYSGYQFDVTLPEGMMVKDVYGQTKASNVFMSGMIDDNTLRVLCASTMGETTESSVVNLTLVADSEGSYIIDIDNAIISANSSTYAMSNSSFLIAIDNDATGISAMSDEASSNDVVYDLTGRKLMSNGNKSSLQKGIYIINGHKITK